MIQQLTIKSPEIKQLTRRQCNLIIEQYLDENDNPRQWDNFSTMICFHGRYRLGDETELKSSDFNSWEDLKKYLLKNNDIAIIKPLYLYDHSGITISSSSFNCPWDSGQVGFIYVEKEKIRDNFDIQWITKKILRKADDFLESELKTYDYYIRGEVYIYTLTDNITGEEYESCGGFYGSDYKTNGILDYINQDLYNIADVVYK